MNSYVENNLYYVSNNICYVENMFLYVITGAGDIKNVEIPVGIGFLDRGSGDRSLANTTI